MADSDQSATNEKNAIRDAVKEYYGKHLKSNKDLTILSNVCALTRTDNTRLGQQALSLVHDDITNKSYGCGVVLPEKLAGTRILDLGSGAGQDCYMLSKLVGQAGFVTGIDMTDEQLDMSRKYIQYHTDLFGYKKPNVEFVKGYLENLEESGLVSNTYDIAVSNCVICLTPDKRQVLQGTYAVLKEGGELYYSDLYRDKGIAQEIVDNKEFWVDGISGALKWRELHTIAAELGFSTPRLVRAYVCVSNKPKLQEALGEAKLASSTFRLFKLPKEREPACLVTYKGTIPACNDTFTLDVDHSFPANKATVVDSETATILKSSRFQDDFNFSPLPADAPKPNTDLVVDPFEYATRSDKLFEMDLPACCTSEAKTCCSSEAKTCCSSEAKTCCSSEAKSFCTSQAKTC